MNDCPPPLPHIGLMVYLARRPPYERYPKEELTLECDYEYEKKSQLRMAEYLRDDPHWKVPDVIEELCSKGVLTTTFAPGVAIDKAAELPQEAGTARAVRSIPSHIPLDGS